MIRTKIFFLLASALLLSACLEQKLIVNRALPTARPVAGVKLQNKTIIRSKIIELGTSDVPTAPDTLTINIANQQEVIIQCKRLKLDRHILFVGANATVTIEYEKLMSNNKTINAELGAIGVFKMEKKKVFP